MCPKSYTPGRWFGGIRPASWLSGLFARLGLGTHGEKIAARHLQSRGMRILKRSYRCPIGEIDLVALDGETLVFVEVRTRADSKHGEPWETVMSKKRRKLSALASYFLKHESAWSDRPARFDIVSIEWNGSSDTEPRIKHIENAFSPQGPWRAE